MRSSRSLRGASPPAALPALLLRMTQLRRKGRVRTGAGLRGLEPVGADGGTDPQGAVAGAPGAGNGLNGPASREGKAPESRLDGGSDGRERAVRDRDVQGRGRLRCVLPNATLGRSVFQGAFRGRNGPMRFEDCAAARAAGALHLGSGALLQGPSLSPQALEAGVKQRFGAIEKKGSMALIERLWRTLKDALGAGRRPDGQTLSCRVPRCGADVALAVREPEARSRRSANGLERAEPCSLGGRTTTNPLVRARQRPPQFPLRPTGAHIEDSVDRDPGKVPVPRTT